MEAMMIAVNMPGFRPVDIWWCCDDDTGLVEGIRESDDVGFEDVDPPVVDASLEGGHGLVNAGAPQETIVCCIEQVSRLAPYHVCARTVWEHCRAWRA